MDTEEKFRKIDTLARNFDILVKCVEADLRDKPRSMPAVTLIRSTMDECRGCIQRACTALLTNSEEFAREYDYAWTLYQNIFCDFTND